jgi:hypothetical protein
MRKNPPFGREGEHAAMIVGDTAACFYGRDETEPERGAAA